MVIAPPASPRRNNRLLIKVDQIAQKWALLLRVCGRNNRAAKGVQTAVAAASPLAGRLVAVTLSSTPVVRKTPNGQRQMVAAHVASSPWGFSTSNRAAVGVVRSNAASLLVAS